MIRVGIMGCAGRMGRAISEVALKDDMVKISALWEAQGHNLIGKDAKEISLDLDLKIELFPKNLEAVDVVIDFTTPLATMEVLSHIKDLNKKLVIGTTGFSPEQRKKIEDASDKIAIVFSPNMSLGVNLLFVLTQLAVSVLPDNYEIEIIEAHHHNKKDAPSGTAMKIWEIIKSARSLSEKDLVCGRSGITGPRRLDEVGMHSIRCADIVGEHTVIFAVEGERIELTHRASSRLSFARGAILAAKFLADKDCGLYDMMDVMGLKSMV